jgi:ferredoxin
MTPGTVNPEVWANGWSIGGNVPWSVGWTAEQRFSLQNSKDFPGLVDLVQVQRPGEGSPKFAQMHVTRHRAGITQHFCHVCGKPTPRHDRFIFPVQSGGIVPVIEADAPRYVGNVPPVHLACAKRAQKLCPHLVQNFADPVPFPSEKTSVRPRLDIVEGMEEVARSLPSGAKVVYSCIRLYGPKFSRYVERLRAAKTL